MKNKRYIAFILAIVVLIIGIVFYFYTGKITDVSNAAHLPDFEQAVNDGDWVKVQEYLSEDVFVLLEGSSCCGYKKSIDAIEDIKRISGLKFNFNDNSESVREYVDREKSAYPNGRKVRDEIRFEDLTIGVEDDVNQKNKAMIAYKIENSKINIIFIAPGRDR